MDVLTLGDLARIGVFLLALTNLALTSTKPPPPVPSSTSSAETKFPIGQDGVMKFPARDCLAVRLTVLKSACPGLEKELQDDAASCLWRNVTPSSLPYHQKDDPVYFGNILPVSSAADAQGWHYTTNRSSCGDLFLQGPIGASSAGIQRVGCVCSHPALSVGHLLCAFDLPKKGSHHPGALHVIVNKSTCHGSSVDGLSATTHQLVKQNHSSSGVLPTTKVNSTDQHGKEDRFKELAVPLAFGIPSAVTFVIGVIIWCVCSRRRSHKEEISEASNTTVAHSTSGMPSADSASEVIPGQTQDSYRLFKTPETFARKNEECVTSLAPMKLRDQCYKVMSPLKHLEDDEAGFQHLQERTSQAKKVLLRRWKHLVNHLPRDNLGGVLLSLFKENIISISEYEEVEAQEKQRGRGIAVETLLQKMCCEKDSYLERFLELLPPKVPGEVEEHDFDEHKMSGLTSGKYDTDSLPTTRRMDSVV